MTESEGRGKSTRIREYSILIKRENLVALIKSLQAASVSKRADQGSPERMAASMSVGAVLTFLHDIGFQPEEMRALVLLNAALQDLEKGKVGAIFEPVKRLGGRPPNEQLRDDRAVLAAIAIDWYRAAGLSTKQAISRFSMAAANTTLGLNGRQAARLRSDIRGHVKGEQIFKRFEDLRDKLFNPNEDPSEQADALVKSLLGWTI
ncbi:hypothetical protein [Ferrovibrio sp.]|uniref:hypothetical protein n=1 Tax=Ferrovibrio sp. TaxID=1917215 RepID=UPI001B5115F5|nr:hypothetical protein [Ferrovibrio sp.]MBP7065744.1 hypothetical protein [Ferrovibrio sp.]